MSVPTPNLGSDDVPADNPSPQAPSALTPRAASARVHAVDVLRGVAVLGILGMNILAFALPLDAYMTPMNEAVNRYAGDFTGGNFAVWIVSHLLLDLKMMAIFSMLFGAGIVLMGDRAPAGRFAGVHYRRMLWLLLIGLAHAYLLWFGDILVIYALCGLIIYPMRRWRPRTLLIVGGAAMLFGMLITSGFGGLMLLTRHLAEQGDPEMLQAWAEMSVDLYPTPERIDAEVAAMRGSYASVFRQNAETTLKFQLFIFPLMMLWRVAGLMLIGMALMKLAVFTAQRSTRFYGVLIAVGYGVGLPIVSAGIVVEIAHGFDFVRTMTYGWLFNQIGSVGVALGHVGVVMLVVGFGMLQPLTDRLGAVGRMALTNYLAQSIICTFIFFGWGLGYFAHFERKWLPMFVIGIWILQLLWSPWWLVRFRFGPAEWLWRSLTYGKLQPMRPAPAPVPATELG